ncbi:MAG: hypothetical protein CMP12_09140 [Zunongwangia sp.]|jgi:hypothetical protein|uniref:Uncharacterized protein n=2 Tax=Zunongwangia profunda TaxID=398743 RepID=D5BJP6_ZUNPS|nr:hypothetical protein [Zunongwangia profunda]MAO36059.1 hypothetical protein [Zunongwangia sp.]ADF53744.1 hypothetical protein ZPR_3428 [Zunongwangia profunda SM-A87]MAS70285.1 hypothetical protein [Zunongwangia sp.]MCC4229072.1 hypothetical protein [Zunongwangia profunda]HCV82707.1 hypothetical protein [Zunongwangia profunda]|tara:strand:+ start:3715 stop:3999 length:285 start_codon:yes stop_codon:yes gene_type:complete
MEENKKTVAELIIYYKKQRLTSLIFDTQQTADKCCETLNMLFNKKGEKEFSFSGEIKTVYSGSSVVEEIKDWEDGKIEPRGTLFEMIKILDRLN